MILFLDTEFTDFIQADLISIGLVSEAWRELGGREADLLARRRVPLG